ncbi:fkbp-type peptidyl-prolyl cis-trans isomerase [Plasmopara halstedii]|uniref:peptidylprolyl isomerase n=1 Tax=Plasmopara halstedii TaxID=4781 RepID=A0A0P1APA6_PLAHL|nr:fkbp-type peptidyl-prolyl cis-trans isomerase [Plasmopara halstedii]CEG43100.1 fkbp-type peptidyl-prolyl cis-trans isomerase [Plasmopara halstedii]|eukprot:XP_024579469.1 fkbp-type peptidyl-prolyl cis-trans isomerase [Plasmopara halstedii]
MYRQHILTLAARASRKSAPAYRQSCSFHNVIHTLSKTSARHDLQNIVFPTVYFRAAATYSTQSKDCVVALGDRVCLHMDGTLSNGKSLPKTQEGAPLKFIVGSGQVLPGVEDAVLGMKKGESKTVTIEAVRAFGEEKQILTVPIKELNLPKKEREMLAVGQVLELAGGERARIVKVTEDKIEIDLAHPYAGQSLTVTIELAGHELQTDLPGDERLVLPEVIEEGDNVTFPIRGDTMVMHYTGKLAKDGKVFDSSRDRGQPFHFEIGVGQVIRGWDEGVMRMSKGMKAYLNIPSVKGYGKSGAGNVIPPDADLIFEVELLDIVRR